MKLTKSKQFLAGAIRASGKVWPDGANWAAQDKCDNTGKMRNICFYGGNEKPTRYTFEGYWVSSCGIGFIKCDKLSNNWHQTCLSREEYFSVYPAEPAADADGWIEWNGGECPVGGGLIVDVEFNCGQVVSGASGGFSWLHEWVYSNIIKYRLHKPEVKPESCEPVTSDIPEPEVKPTIEQLAADYRNANDHANRKQQEADAAKADAEAKLSELVEAGKALGLDVSPITAKQEPELVISDWRDLQVGDVVEIIDSSNNFWKDHSGLEMTVKNVYPDQGDNGDQVYLIGESGEWHLGGNTTWHFIRRP